MRGLFDKVNGMTITGQGPAIIRLGLAFGVVGGAIHYFFPRVAAINQPPLSLRIAATALLVCGLALWIAALVQLLRDFPKGKLVTAGAFAFCRNPMYASFILFIVPAISLFFLTWVYLLISVGMCIGVQVLLPKEEKLLADVFGEEYATYRAKVGRVLPRLW